MKIMLLSDNHGRSDLVAKLMATWRDQVDYLLHAGDSEFAYDDSIWGLADAYVKGNMDFDMNFPTEARLSTPQGKILLVHGHLHDVNHSLDLLRKMAAEEDIAFVFHGHTHKLYASLEEGLLYVNPGSLNHSRGPHPEKTFAIIDIQDDAIQVDFYDDKNQRLDRLGQHFDR